MLLPSFGFATVFVVVVAVVIVAGGGGCGCDDGGGGGDRDVPRVALPQGAGARAVTPRRGMGTHGCCVGIICRACGGVGVVFLDRYGISPPAASTLPLENR